MKKIDLVFRTVGERTSDIALELAKKNIQPDTIHIIENVVPFSEAVNQMLQIRYTSDYVVFMDADCLIMENMRPFLDKNDLPYIDCFVHDKFRGRIHTGVHITRIDLVEEMQHIEVPGNDYRYVLRPESRLRNFALRKLGLGKAFKDFRIYHDYCQSYKHIFAKYALRELRSRTDIYRKRLQLNMNQWSATDTDFTVAKYAVEHTRKHVPALWSAGQIATYIEKLPGIADSQVKKLQIKEKEKFSIQELDALHETIVGNPHIQIDTKIFGIGLSRTGTKSLTKALNLLGFNIVHYPVSEQLFEEMASGNYDFSLLDDLDGITDITVASFYAQLDKLFPGSRFILTVRNKSEWLAGLLKHWEGRSAFDYSPEREIHMKIRRFLRATVYGTYSFNAERMSYIYDLHIHNVREYFKDKPGALLILDITNGDGWEKLCPFFNLPVIAEPFPRINKSSMLQI